MDSDPFVASRLRMTTGPLLRLARLLNAAVLSRLRVPYLRGAESVERSRHDCLAAFGCIAEAVVISRRQPNEERNNDAFHSVTSRKRQRAGITRSVT
jgi:hypothetical protein